LSSPASCATLLLSPGLFDGSSKRDSTEIAGQNIAYVHLKTKHYTIVVQRLTSFLYQQLKKKQNQMSPTIASDSKKGKKKKI
jgi:hypothetical protein